MSLNFAALSPHPPIIIPGIGNAEDMVKAADTSVSLRKLAHNFNEAEIETLIVISPHGLVYPDSFSISVMKKNFGTLAEFGAPEITLEYQNDLDLTAEIITAANKNNINVVPYDNNGEFYELDHGAIVPLYYLRREQESSLKIVMINYSDLSRAEHFSFGQVIGQVAKKYPGRVGILASGDFSHQLIQQPETKNIDLKLVEDLKNNKIEDILYYDEEITEKWFECGYRSLLILLGSLDQTEAVPEVLSYEGPFGVGYLVANFKLKESY